MAKKTIHVVSHTHWDREWYMPFEAHHVRLLKTMDTLLDLFEQDPEYRSFYLDGQTIVLEDYLQVYPEKRDKLIELAKEGKISAGPWYVLQDEFLTSGEANIRNLQVGHRDARPFGAVSKIGYFPDSFGNMGQAPQLLRQAGIDTAIFGRGVKATGFDNKVEDAAAQESPFSELRWVSPDGSEVLGILFANWYSNGNEIPVDKEAAKAFWDRAIAAAERYASTSHLLMMNGCDHQPPQTDLSAALRTARELYPDYEFIHSNFDDYIKAVKAELPQQLSVIKGELRGQHTNGWYTLVNTASARVYIKQKNQKNQTLLEKVAEPLAALAHRHGLPYPHAVLTYAWKTLMQNHPHDSICGCSVDDVYREMTTRFDKSIQVASSVVEESAAYLNGRIDTSGFAAIHPDAVPFVVYNTSGYKGSGVAAVELRIGRRYFRDGGSPADIAARVESATSAAGHIVDAAGRKIDGMVEDLGVQFGYDLPDDKFRQPYMARFLRLTFETGELPGLGYAAFAWIPQQEAAQAAASSLVAGPTAMENEWLKVTIEPDGGITLLDKRSGQTYAGLGHYEDVGDIGNEYIFKQPEGDAAITTVGRPAEIRLVEDTPFRASFEVTHRLPIPAQADDLLQREVQTMVPFLKRKAGRSGEMTELSIVTRISLERSGRGVKIHAKYVNTAKDHRLRMLFPSGVAADTHFVDSVLEVAERDTTPAPEWVNPSNCQHQQAFVDVHASGRGLTIGNKGLNEYEVLRDGQGTIAVTLLRAVGELGDWGVFPTPEAQCLGPNEAELIILPHNGSDRFDAYTEAYRFQVPLTASQTDVHAGTLPPVCDMLEWEGKGLAFSNLKVNEDRGELVARWYNMSDSPVALRIRHDALGSGLYASTIMEDRREDIATEDGAGKVELRGFEIFTAGFDR
ncbi:alpha-mannosidase [Paenibacillus sp. 32O-W]|uniref:alpha-mannosidase n=1 Tax=Paenibacillus sp. 32O-W TaxID=1695218 RepID=UPI00071F630C|nr:alpha-mannosidase [Paenibacillus sp. 32O-W]ALS26621.1 alpha-mannosidase [Paenibacillus sp. 32O-W]